MVSATGGIPPSVAERRGGLWQMARRRPFLTKDITAGAGVKVQCVCPASTEFTEGPPPLCGTISDSKSAIDMKSTPERWLCEPTPAEAMLMVARFARA